MTPRHKRYLFRSRAHFATRQLSNPLFILVANGSQSSSLIQVSLAANDVPYIRTPDANFAGITDFPYLPQYLEVDGLRMHYVDEGPRHAPVVLMVHGMPTWSYLYRHMIPRFLTAGFRCVAPDHIGFGRSDKVTNPDWYDIARHTSNLRYLVESLDLQDITLVVQDWGGPIGLAQYVSMPQRFSRLVIMNTWLHHAEYEYTPGIRSWIEQNKPGGLFFDNVPDRFNWGTLMAMATQRVSPQDSIFAVVSGGTPEYSSDALSVKNAYDAPFEGLGERGVTGPRRFPLSIPLHDPRSGNASVQEQNFAVVNSARIPVHFVWGANDSVFTREWGLTWHGLIPHSTWFEVSGSHFLQDTHGAEIADHVIQQIG